MKTCVITRENDSVDVVCDEAEVESGLLYLKKDGKVFQIWTLAKIVCVDFIEENQ